MYRIACVSLLLFVSVTHAQPPAQPPSRFAPLKPLRIPDKLTTFGWDCVKEELDLTEGQSLKGRDQALRKELNFTLEWWDSVMEDNSLSEREKFEKIDEVADKYTEEKSKWVDELLLPHQLARLEQCRYWLAFKLNPLRVLRDEVWSQEGFRKINVSESSLAKVEEVYSQYIVESNDLLRAYRVEAEKVYEANIGKDDLHRLANLGEVRPPSYRRTLSTEEKEWIRRVIIPKVRDDMTELDEKLKEDYQVLFNIAQMKMLDCLTRAERARWDELAGKRVEFPVHPNEIVERIGNGKYTPDGRGRWRTIPQS